MNWKLIRHIDRYVGIPLVRLISLFKETAVPPPPITGSSSLLLIKFWGIGNLFMMLPAIARLRSSFPSASIHLLTLESNRETTECLPPFTSIITIDTSSPLLFFNSILAALAHIRSLKCDLAIDFEQFARFSPLIVALGGCEQRLGFKTAGQHRHLLFTSAITYDNSLHTADSFVKLLEPVVPSTFAPSPLISAKISESARTRGMLLRKKCGFAPGAPLVLMHVTTSSNFMERCWPIERFIQLAQRLHQQYGIRTILTGLSHELDLPMRDKPLPECCINRIGLLNFHDFFSLIATANLVLSADTSAVHIASALNTPVIGLYGPNTSKIYGPWGDRGIAISEELPCSPCITNFNAKINTCRHHDGRGACMHAISVEAVHECMKAHYHDLLSTKNEEMTQSCSDY